MKRVIPIVLVLVAALGWKFYNKNQASAEVRAQGLRLLESFPEYAAHKDFYLSAFDEAHNTAFDKSYTLGGRRRAAKFDSEKYVSVLVAIIKQKATASGNTSVAYSLNGPQRFFSLPVAESGESETSRY